MKTTISSRFPLWSQVILVALGFFLAVYATAGSLQLVSIRHPFLDPPAGGNGESGLPIISPDGRYVLFASTANNLVLMSNGSPMTVMRPPILNVFLRDRTNATTTLVSVNLTGTGSSNGDSLPQGISSDGRYALFESSASDLVTGDNNGASDVFVRDMSSGTTLLVSVATDGTSGNGASRSSVMTPDGRYVAFVSAATNLVASDTNGIPDVFVRDLRSGTMTLASVGATSTGSYTFPSSSESPEMTPDGRYVAFYSSATNLVAGGVKVGEVYVRDLAVGTTIWASTNAVSLFKATTGQTNEVSFNLKISTNGQFITFETCTNLPAGPYARGLVLRYNLNTGLTDIIHTNANVPLGEPFESIHSLDMTPDGRFVVFAANTNCAIYFWDAQTGSNTLISVNTNGTASSTAGTGPVMDAGGRMIAFVSAATDLTTNTLTGTNLLFVRDVLASTTRLVSGSADIAGVGIDPIIAPALSADGSTVAFECADGSLVPDDNNRARDVFVRDLTTDTTSLISSHDPALPAWSPNGYSVIYSTSISTNGRYVAFVSDGNNLVANDTNGTRDVFVRDLVVGTNFLVSANTNGFAGSGMSGEPSISADGRCVAFSSFASDLMVGDTNNAEDVFVRDLQAGTNTLVSVSVNGGFGNDDSLAPVISADGRFVLFQSKAQNLAAGSYSSQSQNLFLRDQLVGTNYALTYSGVTCASMTPDGHYIAYVSSSSPAGLYVWSSLVSQTIYTNTTSTILNTAISPDGRWLLYLNSSPSQLNAVDLLAGTNLVIATLANYGGYSHAGLNFSGDGRFMAYAVATGSSTNQNVYLYDFQSGTNLLISRPFNSAGMPNRSSDSPVISSDGRYVAWRSFASNCVPNDFNDVSDVFLYDRLTGATLLVSVNSAGTATANNCSFKPVFSGDGQTLIFASWASDLSIGDGNEGGDLFALDLSASTNCVSTNLDSGFGVQMVGGGGAEQTPVILWPVVAGASGVSYQVQFTDDLSAPSWQPLASNVVLLGTQGYACDLVPATSQRFYRLVIIR